MSVTYKGITFVSIYDAAKLFSEPVWKVEEPLYGEIEQTEQEFPFCWLLVLCLAIATAPAILVLAYIHQSLLT